MTLNVINIILTIMTRHEGLSISVDKEQHEPLSLILLFNLNLQLTLILLQYETSNNSHILSQTIAQQ